jgi:hypothetical protein
MPVPYPARRAYAWLQSPDPIPYDVARRMFNRMRYQQTKANNPARFVALSKVIDALYILNHDRDIELFPPKRLHALLCAAADEAGWYTDPTTFRKPRLSTPPGFLHCTGCDQVLPDEVFESGRLSHLCCDCRDKRAERINTKTSLREAKACAQRFERLMGVRDGIAVNSLLTRAQLQKRQFANREWLSKRLKKHLSLTPTVQAQLSADVYPYYKNLLTTLHRDTRHAINRHTADDTRNEPKAGYYRTKLKLVQQALDELERMLDEGTVHALTEGQVHWTRLLDADALDTLVEAHAEMSAALRSSEKLPALTTYRDLDRALERMRDELDKLNRDRQKRRVATRKESAA